MEPLLAAEPFDSPEHIFQVKWDGVRCLAFLSGGNVRLQNRRLQERTRHYPELAVLPLLAGGREAVLDGEIIALRDGRPSFPLVLERDLVREPGRNPALQRRVPITYVVFDVLSLDGRDLLREPLASRLERLSSLLIPHEQVLVTDSFPAQGKSLFQAVEERGLEGIVAKHRASPYLPGQKTRFWQKVKCWREDVFPVGGYTLREGQPSALLVGRREGECLRFAGRAGSGISQAEWPAWQAALESRVSKTSPFTPAPRLGKVTVRWCRPEVYARVRYLEWTPELRLRSPVVLGLPL